MTTAREFLILLAGAAFLGGCSSTTSPLPPTDTSPPAPSSSSVFAGHTIRIRQERPALEGRVQETVELLSKGKGHKGPFMKMEEEGLVYRPVRP